MDAEAVALVGGLGFLLLAIVGGGVTVKEVHLPELPTWGRAASLVTGMVLVLPFVLSVPRSDGDGAEPAEQPPGAPSAAPGSVPPGETVVHAKPEGVASPAGIEVSAVLATAEREPVAVGDQLRVQYSLRNVGADPVTFDNTFVGARSPGSSNRDFGEDNAGLVVAPGDGVQISATTVLDAAGTWRIWPCYGLRADEVDYCPDEWQAFEVLVR